MKVLVADKFEDAGLAGLKALGVELTYDPDAKDDKLLGLLREAGPDVLIVRSTKVTKPMLQASRLSLVIRAGAGYNTIDVETASSLGIYVSNCPGKNSVAVAELAFALLLSLDRRVPDNVESLRKGEWNKKEFSKARGVKGQTLGLVGLGNIALEMVPRALAFGMPVVAWSRSLTAAKAEALGISMAGSPEDVAARCDVLSVHLALSADTRGRIGASVFGKLKGGAIFLNTSRAEVVDQAALLSAIQEKGIRAGLDVFEKEPSAASGSFEDPIVKNGKVYGTHHIGASTDQAQNEIAMETVRIVSVFKTTGQVPNVVNLARSTPTSHLLVVRHLDKVGVLAHVFNQLKSLGINVQETQNLIFEGAKAAVARIGLDGPLTPDQLSSLKAGNENILDLSVLPTH